MCDFELRNKLKSGDPNAFCSFYRETYLRLIGYCSLFIKDAKLR